MKDVIINVPLDDYGTTDFTDKVELPLSEDKEKVDVLENNADKDTTNNSQEDIPVDVAPIDSVDTINTELLEKAERFLGSEYLDNSFVEDDEGNKISAKDYIKDIDTLLDIVSAKYEDDLGNIKSNSVSTENLDQIQKDIVNIVAKGGNPLELISLQKDYLQPLSEIDIETEEGQIEAIRIDLEDKGNTEDVIDILIEGYKAKGILEEKGIASKETLDKKYKDRIEEVAKQEEQRLLNLEKQHKEYVKSITSELKSLGYNDKTVKDFKEFATVIKSRGDNSTARMTDMDSAYLEARNNPKTAIDLILYLKNPEEFKKTVSKQEVSKNNLETSKKIVISKTSRSNSSGKTAYEQRLEEKNGTIAVIPV